MLTNPLSPIVEFWLTFYNALPLPFRTYFSLTLGFILVIALLGILWRIK